MSTGTALAPEPASESISALNQFLYGSVVKALYTKWTRDVPQVTLSGYLGCYADKLWREKTYYGVPLQEQARGGEKILLQVPAELLTSSGIEAGDFVTVVGLLKVRVLHRTPSFDVQIEVAEISRPEQAERQLAPSDELINLQRILHLSRRRIPFPVRDHLRILVIHPLSALARVREDFLNAIRSLSDHAELQLAGVSMLDPSEIAAAIDTAEGDILVLIRGGGPEEDFRVFNDERIVTAMQSKTMYRVAGLGHSGNATLLDWICDFSADTPSAAGAHIAEMASDVGAVCDERWRDLQEENEELRTQVSLQETWRPPESQKGQWHPAVMTAIVGILIIAAVALLIITRYSGPLR